MKTQVLSSNPNPKSQAASLLLKQKLIEEEQEHIPFSFIHWLKFRKEYLTELEQINPLHCHYCNKGPLIIDADNSNPMVATIDHKIPTKRSDPEYYNKKNMLISCHKCNMKKRNLPYDEFIKRIKP